MYFITKQCKRCGKMFIPAAEHLYKLQEYADNKTRKTNYYCSYNCWRKDGGDNGKRSL